MVSVKGGLCRRLIAEEPIFSAFQTILLAGQFIENILTIQDLEPMLNIIRLKEVR